MEQTWIVVCSFSFCFIILSAVFFNRTFKTKILRTLITEKLLFVGRYSINNCFEKLVTELLAKVDFKQIVLSDDRAEFPDKNLFPKVICTYTQQTPNRF